MRLIVALAATLVVMSSIFLHTASSLRASVEEGDFKIPVPSLPFTVKVSETGYEDWYYKAAREGSEASALLMAPNSTKKLLVALHPVGRSK
jgi:hypothetical protein